MRKNNFLKIIVCLVLVFTFYVICFTIKQFDNKKIGNDRIELYAGNIEDNNPGQGFSINDENRIWGQTQNINIYNKEYLFPGDSGTYQFLVSNNTDEEAEYDLDLQYATNADTIMKFKLKKNGVYVHGDASDEYGENYESSLPSYVGITLAAHEQHLYILEWKWVDDGADEISNPVSAGNYLITASFNATATEIYYYVPPVEDPNTTDPNSATGSADTTDNTSGVNVATGDTIRYYVILAILSGTALALLSIRKKQKVKNESIQNS